MTAFRVFSGWDARQADAAEVFAYSVRENASIPVEVQFLVNAIPDRTATTKPAEFCVVPGFNRIGVTAFSYIRFMAPFACDYQGVAAFFDGCDQLCLGDVAELAALDMGDYAVRVVKHPNPDPWHPPEYKRSRVWSSVMLMDCAKLQWWTPAYVENAADSTLMRFQDLSDEMIGDLPPEWNYLMPPDANIRDPHELVEDQADLLHWSYLSDPNGGSWIDRSGSALWADWRERWRAAR